MPRRVVITVCVREPGSVVLPVRRGDRARRLDARAIFDALESLVTRQGLGGRVQVREACAGGCQGPGPNVSVASYSMPAPGARVDHVAVGWKTYVYSLPALACLAQVIEENLDEPRRARPARGSRGPGRRTTGAEVVLQRTAITAARRRSGRAGRAATRRGAGSPRQ
jgi:hypothetical protein